MARRPHERGGGRLAPRLVRSLPQSARQLRTRRVLHRGQCQRFRRRRLPRHHGWRRCRHQRLSNRHPPHRPQRPQLWRLHDHVDGDPDLSFTAAVAGAGICDWLSYYGLNDIDEWMLPFFGASIYDDPAVYQKSDPLHFFKNVKTPTLILVGDRDGEVPMEQSVEWYHALQTLKSPHPTRRLSQRRPHFLPLRRRQRLHPPHAPMARPLVPESRPIASLDRVTSRQRFYFCNPTSYL